MLSTKNQAQFKELLTTALRGGASDIHLSVGTLPIMRINGALQIISENIVITTEFVEELAGHLADLDEKELKKGDQLFFAVNLDTSLRAKITIFYQKGLPAITLRFIAQNIQTLEQLKLPATIEGFTNRKNGLVIITGSYGSGKTATMAALIQNINSKHKRYIVTLEKPIEYMYTSQLSVIEQREVGKDTESFEKALGYLQHEDVDVVAVSSLSSEESIEKILELARGNSLVLLSFESSSVVSALEKILNMVSPDKKKYIGNILAEVFAGGVASKLIPKIGGGLIPAIELLISNEPTKAAIEKSDYASIMNLQSTGGGDGALTFDRSLIELVQRHLITQQDALLYAENPKVLSRVLGSRLNK